MGDLPPPDQRFRAEIGTARQSTSLGAAAYSSPLMATIFEKIIAGEIPPPSSTRTDRVTAFRDISPQAPVHVLIVPNKPIPTVNDVSEDDERTLGHMFVVARDLARAEGIAEDGFRLIINCNKHGGQVVYHLHMHLLGGAMLGPMLSGGKHG
jgi:histidine triad (HIT) family protein